MTTQFVYDEAGHLIEEANASGAVQKEYIWLDDMPVAMVDSTGASPVLYFIHTDQLDTPQKITDGSMNVVWDGVFDPFGNPASGASLALTNLRFPRQYFDSESGLYQNWHRDYDSTVGRYIQSDPLGLNVGINTYNYADSNPVVFADQTGQQTMSRLLSTDPPSTGGLEYKTMQDYSKEGRAALNLLGRLGMRLGKLCFGEVDCRKQLDKCRQMCLNIYVKNPNNLPGQGPDYQGRMRRCVRECMVANGCRDY